MTQTEQLEQRIRVLEHDLKRAHAQISVLVAQLRDVQKGRFMIGKPHAPQALKGDNLS